MEPFVLNLNVNFYSDDTRPEEAKCTYSSGLSGLIHGMDFKEKSAEVNTKSTGFSTARGSALPHLSDAAAVKNAQKLFGEDFMGTLSIRSSIWDTLLDRSYFAT